MCVKRDLNSLLVLGENKSVNLDKETIPCSLHIPDLPTNAPMPEETIMKLGIQWREHRCGMSVKKVKMMAKCTPLLHSNGNLQLLHRNHHKIGYPMVHGDVWYENGKGKDDVQVHATPPQQ
jgi:hypothetical protein